MLLINFYNPPSSPTQELTLGFLQGCVYQVGCQDPSRWQSDQSLSFEDSKPAEKVPKNQIGYFEVTSNKLAIVEIYPGQI